MSIPIVCFVGKSDSGKTTFLEKVIAELRRRGYRVGVVKHDTHASEPDRPGKDTWRLRRAGSPRVMLSSARYFALVGEVEEELALEEIAGRYLNDVQMVLAEGYKRSPYPKVEVCRAERSRELLCSPEELLAVVSDLRFDLPCPQFGLDDAGGVADLLEERFLRRPADPGTPQVALRVDGRPVPLKPFIQAMLAGAVRGLLGALKGGTGGTIELHIQGRQEG
ncbi:MAG: molybdopterin-guanine dinucleotide biosynthesis protein B [Chloroflexia bacterium]